MSSKEPTIIFDKGIPISAMRIFFLLLSLSHRYVVPAESLKKASPIGPTALKRAVQTLKAHRLIGIANRKIYINPNSVQSVASRYLDKMLDNLK